MRLLASDIFLWLEGRLCTPTHPLLSYFPNRIDLPCPKGWWGNPVCGPCHCAVSKGFDPDCNKTNGQCQCKVSPARGQILAAFPPPSGGHA